MRSRFKLVLWPVMLSALMLLVVVRSDDCPAQEAKDVEKIIQAGRTDNQVMSHLDVLTNQIGGRLTGSVALQEAGRWAVERFKSFGIENARVIEGGVAPLGFYRGQQAGWMISPDKKPLYFGTRTWSAGTKGVQRGPALLTPTREEFDKNKGKYQDVWIVRIRRGGEGAVSNDELIEAGILGLINSAGSERILTIGKWPKSLAELPTTPMVNMGQAQFDEIRELLQGGHEVVLEFDIRNHFRQGPISFPNVIADIPGVEFPDEYVIIGGHLDSWDEGTGAVDNGTGVATTMEAARILMAAGVKPRRTIRFMLWGGEEQGLIGSRNYVKANPELLPKISAVFVHDLGSDYLSSIRITESMKDDFAKVLAPVKTLNEKYPFNIQVVDTVRKGSSDHDAFIEAGVPGFIWRQSGGSFYGAGHTPLDTYDKAVPEFQEHSSIVVALTAYGVANLDHLISRKEMEKR